MPLRSSKSHHDGGSQQAEGLKPSLLQVNYFPSRFDPVRHAERFPENRMHISGTRERRMIDKVRCSSLCSVMDS